MRHRFIGTTACTLGNSGISYAEGRVFVRCSCGWQRISRLDRVTIAFCEHVSDALQSLAPTPTAKHRP